MVDNTLVEDISQFARVVYLDTVNDAAITNIKWVHDEHEDDCLNKSLAHIAKQKCYEQHL
jgi:hypothetical protein